jgi:hypothetical protein
MLHRWASEPPTFRGALSVATDRVVGRVRPILVRNHAVPEILATRKDRVGAFAESWHRWVSSGAQPLRATEPDGQRIVELHRGDDPFEVETQLRTLWT